MNITGETGDTEAPPDAPQDQAYYQKLAGKLRDGSITPEERKMLDQWYDNFHQQVDITGAFDQDRLVKGDRATGLNKEQNRGQVKSQRQSAGTDKESTDNELVIRLPPELAVSEAAHSAKLRAGIDKKIKRAARIKKRSEGEDKASRKSNTRSVTIRRGVTAAAAVLLLMAGLWFLRPMLRSSSKSVNVTASLQHHATPGHTGAVLRLSGGKTIVLDSLKDGVVLQQGDVKIVKENGSLKYLGKSNKTVYNDVVTDKGRQWHMYLPDGSQVWLNAGSSLHFPVCFKGQKERIVTLTGEAFFKVVHNDAQPFKVIAGTQVIEDIGTSFNVNAYEDEAQVRTTLVEGALKVNKVDLRPGWQASSGQNGQIQTRQVNTDEITAWINGQLSLNNVSVEEIMKQLSRWYNVTVVYEGAVPRRNLRLGGLLDKNASLEDIVKSLRDFNIDVRLQNQQLVVGP
jgi:ferric-dicitrate binding protein FerR (iron transport regulator)